MRASFTQMMSISKSGMEMRLQDLDVVSNNMANFNTTGYKQVRSNFQELLNFLATQQTAESANGQTATSVDLISIANGVQITSTQTDFLQGAFKTTDSPLDLAISGEGFFGVRTADGETAYTRNGGFLVDAQGTLVDGDGNSVIWDGTLPDGASDVQVDTYGNVSHMENGERITDGTIALFRFSNSSGLDRLGNNLWKETEYSGAAQEANPGDAGYGIVKSYTLESSNVDLALQFTRMLTLQRGFQLSTRALQQADKMMAQAVQLRS